MAPYSHTDAPAGRLARWIDERVGASRFVRSKLNYVFPIHFSFLFGELALYSFVFLVLTGTFLALFYVPGEQETVYQGVYGPLRGVPMTEAYKSVLELSFSVRAGLLIRQAHHWAALVFTGAMLVHMARVFFTGGFRRPRELTWITGLTMLLLAIAEGFMGYSLLDDLLSGTGLRIGYSLIQSIPVVGTWIASLLFDGAYPGSGVFGRLFTLHVFVVPALLAGLIALHLGLIVRQHHAQFPGRRRTEHNVVGTKMWPTYATKSAGLFFLTCAALTAMGGWLQINPVWLYGPYDPFVVTSGAQADWYVLWLQGALRLMPGVSLPVGPYTVPNQFFPGVLLPVVLFGVLYAWPFLEARLTDDHHAHHLLDRPRDRPVRTAVGTAGLAALAVLLIAGSDDVIAATFDWSIVTMRWTERVLVLVVPLVVGLIAWRVCHDLAARPEAAESPEPEPEPTAAPSDQPHPTGPRTLPRPGGRALRAGIGVSLAIAIIDELRQRIRRR